MAKIIKHTFEIPHIEVIDGELVQTESTKETYTFTLLHKGVGIYEELSGEVLLNSLLKFDGLDPKEMASKILDKTFLLNLASASYVKIDGDAFHNNRATAEEFKKLPVAQHIYDVDFARKLIEMGIECLTKEVKENTNNEIAKKRKK